MRSYKAPDGAIQRPERAEQIDCIAWVREHYPEHAKLTFHPVNEGRHTAYYRNNLIKQGLLKGVSDIVCLKRSGDYPYALFELKRCKDSYPSKEQKEFMLEAEREGAFVAVCNGFDAFKKAWLDYAWNLSDNNQNNQGE